MSLKIDESKLAAALRKAVAEAESPAASVVPDDPWARRGDDLLAGLRANAAAQQAGSGLQLPAEWVEQFGPKAG